MFSIYQNNKRKNDVMLASFTCSMKSSLIEDDKAYLLLNVSRIIQSVSESMVEHYNKGNNLFVFESKYACLVYTLGAEYGNNSMWLVEPCEVQSLAEIYGNGKDFILYRMN